MLTVEEFRTGHVSLPVDDADDLPKCCFSCHYLFGKEFSVGEGITYLCCGYLLSERNIKPVSQVYDWLKRPPLDLEILVMRLIYA